jgi:cytochrome c oxidase assembly protein Cox11
MIWFEYKYTTASEIIKNIKLLVDYSIIEYSILAILVIFLILSIYYLVPLINIIRNQNKINKEINKKKEMLKTILIQNKINEEIEKEVNIH